MSRFGPICLAVASVFNMVNLAERSFAQQPPEKRFITRDGTRPDGLFAPGMMVGKTLYVSGKGDYRPEGDLGEKVRNCLNEIQSTLELAGLSKRHVVKTFCYLEEPAWYDEFNVHYGEFFDENPPARTTLGVPLVPGESRIEITAIAYADLDQRRSLLPPAPGGRPYSSAVLAGDTLYVSGKGDQNPDGTHPASFADQVRQTMRNVVQALELAKLDSRHIVLLNVFLDDRANHATADSVLREFFAEGQEPARATTVVDWIPGGSHIEITAIATTDLDSRVPVRPEGLQLGPNETVACPAVWAGDTLYLSGMTGQSSADGAHPASMTDQVTKLAENQLSVLRAAQLDLEDIVAGWVNLADMEEYAPMNEEYRKYFSRGPGTRTTLMPNSMDTAGQVRVSASFIAARTRPAQ